MHISSLRDLAKQLTDASLKIGAGLLHYIRNDDFFYLTIKERKWYSYGATRNPRYNIEP
ncbi:hypothetical protein [Legionella maioricensis]|uniref:Uncharacterized protein n=1 Tax=Legionella maioricensis TaxID=2896528 RepID=A0A9X2IBA1_9GAMM|nr:hypothetical protein [Legionella maioricensis]MCL9684275.1 hypothetical protein [Legionella maioricensis]MCL9687141.1 hypothetical protein [Legionella maioricensis]